MRNLDRLWSKGKDFLGVDYPIICGAMTWISTFDLVKAISAHGGFGILAGENMPPEVLALELDRCLDGIDQPFGVNIVTSSRHYQSHLDILEKLAVKFVILAGNIPSETEIMRMKNTGKQVLAYAQSAMAASQLLKHGVDGLIIKGFEAGGRVGDTSTTVLLQEILFTFPEVTIFVAGGIATGKMAAHLFLMGAAGIQLGTRFVLTNECKIHPNVKQALIKAQSRHALKSTQISSELPIIGVRTIKNSVGEDFSRLQIDLLGRVKNHEISKEEAFRQIDDYWLNSLKKAIFDGDTTNGSIMAGQSVGLINTIISMQQVFDDFIHDAEAELQRMQILFA